MPGAPRSPRTRRPNRVGPTGSPAQRTRLSRQVAAAGENVVLEIDGHEVAITHLDRVYWPSEPALDQPAVTKRDFVRYLIAAASMMLPHLIDRPLTLFRWPNGVAGRRVLQKHWEIAVPPFVERTNIFSDAKGHTDEYAMCNNLATLVWLAHMGTLEIHAWHSRVRTGPDSTITSTDFESSTAALQSSIIEYPDYILFDLDPFIYAGNETRANQPELNVSAFALVKEIALSLKVLLDDMSLFSLVKTSGKTGLHVVVPIRRTVRYDVARELARLIGVHLMRVHPGEITLQWTVQKRTGKVFMDTNMNVRGKSMTTPYSPRGLPGAPVSMPIAWRDLARVYPMDFRIPTVFAQLPKQRDPWAELITRKQPIEARLAAGARK